MDLKKLSKPGVEAAQCHNVSVLLAGRGPSGDNVGDKFLQHRTLLRQAFLCAKEL